jgi:hypothetical protein
MTEERIRKDYYHLQERLYVHDMGKGLRVRGYG